MDEKTKNSILKAKFFKNITDIKDNDLEVYTNHIKEFQNNFSSYASSLALADEKVVHPGDDIIICGKIGMAGTLFLLDFFKSRLLRTLSNFYIDEAESLRPYADSYPDMSLLSGLNISNVIPIGERGLFKGIYDLGKSSQLGFCIDYSKVPVSQHTIEFCEIFDLDPWGLLSGGCVLITAKGGQQVVSKLSEAGFDAAVVGYITKEKSKLITYRDNRGGINRPIPDELLKVIKDSVCK